MADPTFDDQGDSIPASEATLTGAPFVETVGSPVFCDVCGAELRNGDAYYPTPARHVACNALVYREAEAEGGNPQGHTRS